MNSPLLTSSRLKDARACQRLHHYKYDLGYRPTEDSHALRFGSLIHRGLEAWWLAPLSERLDAALAALTEESDPFDVARAQALLCGYHERWMDAPLRALAVEKTFALPLRNPLTGRASHTWQLAGKLDAVVETPDGRRLLLEHKTSSEDIRPGSDYWRRLRLDGQVSIYYAGAGVLGFDVQGCLYDVLGKPALRPLKRNKQRSADETPEEFRARVAEAIGAEPAAFYRREEVVRLEEEMTEALYDVWQIGQQIRESQHTHRAPRNPDACMRWGRTCPFFDVCSGSASLDDETKFVRSSVVHPELAEPSGEREAGGTA